STSPHPHLRATTQSPAATLPSPSVLRPQCPRTHRSLKRQMNPSLMTTFTESIVSLRPPVLPARVISNSRLREGSIPKYCDIPKYCNDAKYCNKVAVRVVTAM